MYILESTAVSHQQWHKRFSYHSYSQIKYSAEVKEWELRLCLTAPSWGSEHFANARTCGTFTKNPPAKRRRLARGSGSIPGSGRSPGGGHDNPLQFSCLENPMDRGAWWATVHGVTKSPTWLKRLSTARSSNCSAKRPWVSSCDSERTGPQLWRWQGQQGSPRALTTRTLGSYWRLFKELDFLSSISSMGEEEDSRELSEGLKEGLLLSPWSTRSELGRSSRAWKKSEQQSCLPPTQPRRLKLGPGGLLRQNTQQAWPVTPQNLWVWSHKSV